MSFSSARGALGNVIVICSVSASWALTHPNARLWSQSLRDSQYPGRASPAARAILTPPESRSQARRPVIDRLELITDQAAVGSDGSNWGANKLRVIRALQNVFAVYIVDAEKTGEREWRLAQRGDQQWKIIAKGPSGREPVNLLRGPKDELYVISWPDGLPQISRSTTAADGQRTFIASAIPGLWTRKDQPYHSAGIGANGDIWVLMSDGAKPGIFDLAYYQAQTGRWLRRRVLVDYRHTYAFLFPNDNGALSLVASKDVRWEVQGYERPRGAFDYVFDGIKYWHFASIDDQFFKEVPVYEERQTDDYPYVNCFVRDAYQDTKGRIHILYIRQGKSSRGKVEGHHAIIEGGAIVKDVVLPSELTKASRIFQDSTGKFWVLTAFGRGLYLYSSDSEDGAQLNAPLIFDSHGYDVDATQNGLQVAARRAGVPATDYVDGLFSAGKGEKLIYFRFRLR
jgi:hypothetical protein